MNGRRSEVKSLFDGAAVEEIKGRIAYLQPASARQWGKMDAAQMLAHCSIALEMAMGRVYVKRIWMGRLIGGMAKRAMIEQGKPMMRNAKTPAPCEVGDKREFELEKRRLLDSIDAFVAGGSEKCATYPHFFFGEMSPMDWSVLGYQHLDHHLRQFRI
jgi:hypothetical protein